MEYKVVEKTIDREGRILLPKAWRVKHGKEVVILQIGDEIRVLPKEKGSLLKMPALNVDVKTRMGDWKEYEKELLSV